MSRLVDPRWFYAAYTLAFAIVALLVFAPYWLDGRTFIWRSDGATQHFLVLGYFVDWIKGAAALVASGQAVPVWDLRVGFGADLPGTLGYYGFGDPLNAIAALFPESYGWLAYTSIALLRLFLAGIAFCLYCRHFRFESWSTLCGSLVYVFSAFSVYVIARHPFFITPMLFLPLVCLGVEHIFEKRLPYLYTFSLFGMFWVNFYFAYMICLFTLGYVIIRYAMSIGSLRPRVLFPWVGKFALWSVVAACLAAPMLLPSICGVLDSVRSGSGYDTPLLFSAKYYWRLLVGFVVPCSIGKWCFLGCTSLAVLSLLFLFSSRGRDALVLKVAAVLLLVTVTLPLIGRLFNGMSYVANRHAFGVVFFVGVLIAWALPKLFAMTGRQSLFVAGGAALYAVIVAGGGFAGYALGEIGKAGLIVSALALLALAVSIASVPLLRRSARLRALGKFAMVAVAIVVLVIGGYALASSDAPSRLTVDQAAILETENVFEGLAPSDDGEIYRCDASSAPDKATGSTGRQNRALATEGVYYDSQYFSITDGQLSEFMSGEMEVAQQMHGYNLKGVNERAALLALTSTKYWFGSDGYVPFGFVKTDVEGVYENSAFLHFGYAYDAALPRSEYDALNPVDKQEALLQAALVEDDAKVDVELVEVNPEAVKLDAEVRAEDGIEEIESGVFRVTGETGQLRLSFEPCEDAELYVELRGVVALDEGDDPRTITAQAAGVSRPAIIWRPGGEKYVGFDDVLYHLGYSGKKRDEATITFEDEGVYSIDEVVVYAVPMDDHVARVAALDEGHLEGVSLSANAISGDISADSTKLLCLPIVYSLGWKAKVDGRDVDTLRLNTWMLGVQVEAGEHHVEFEYATPGSDLWIALALLAIVVLAVYPIARRRISAHGSSEAVALGDMGGD